MDRRSHAHRAAGNYRLGRTDSIPPEWSEKASAKITFDLGLEGIETGRVGGQRDEQVPGPDAEPVGHV